MRVLLTLLHGADGNLQKRKTTKRQRQKQKQQTKKDRHYCGFDLKAALLEEGVGTDRTWKFIGDVVEAAAKKHGRSLTNWLNGLMPRFENTGEIDPLLMRNKMRNEVKKYFDYLRETGEWQRNDPFKGLSGTDLLPF